MKKLIAVFALISGFACVSQAGVLIEPYLGYEMGTTKDAIDGKLEGTQMGLRLAYTAPVFFWAGLDATMGMSAKAKADGVPDEEAKRTTVSGVVGVDFPILVRAWLGYSFVNEIKFDAGKYKGNQTKVGVGFTGLPFVSLNFEYVTEKFDKFEDFTVNPELKNDSYVVSVSLPFEF